jgi:hypothetical protein
MSNQDEVPLQPNSPQSIVRRGLRLLIADNIGCRNRVKMLFEAVSVAHAFTLSSQSARLGQILKIPENEPSSDNEQIKLLREGVAYVSSSMATGLSSTMRASAVILAHSHIDDALNRILLLCVCYKPDRWKSEIYQASKTRYTLRDLDGLDPTKMMVDAANQYLAALKHKKITKRNDLLLRHLGQFAQGSNLKRMSSSSLDNFDSKRHELIHENILVRGDLDESIESQCLEVIGHVDNLLHSLVEYVDLSWDALTNFLETDQNDVLNADPLQSI